MDESSSHMGHLVQSGWYSMVTHSELERSTMLFMGKLTKYLSSCSIVMGIRNDWDSPYSFDSWWAPLRVPISWLEDLGTKTPRIWLQLIVSPHCGIKHGLKKEGYIQYVFAVTKKEENVFLNLTWLQYPILKLTKQLLGCCYSYSVFHANRMIHIYIYTIIDINTLYRSQRCAPTIWSPNPSIAGNKQPSLNKIPQHFTDREASTIVILPKSKNAPPPQSMEGWFSNHG